MAIGHARHADVGRACTRRAMPKYRQPPPRREEQNAAILRAP